MSSQQVLRPNEINLNSLAYHIKGPVRSNKSSVSPERGLTISYMDDWRDGLGAEILDDEVGRNRYFWSTWNPTLKGHLILPRLATVTSGDPGGTPTVLGHLNGEVYARWGTSIHKFNNSTDTWGSAVETGLGAVVGDFINVTIDNGSAVLTTYLIHAYSTGYTYTTDGASWTKRVQPVLYCTFYDDKLWGMSELNGQLWRAFTPGDETLMTCLPVEAVANGELPTDILTGLDEEGEEVIYVSSNRGVYAYDVDNDLFKALRISIPAGETNGVGTEFWRNSIFYPAGAEIYQYTPGETSTFTQMGPGTDAHGLPDDQKGRIEKIIGTHNELLALIDPTELSSNTGASFSILAWNPQRRSWRCLHEHGTANIAPSDMMASNAYGVYRLWYSYATSVEHIDIPYAVINDLQTTDANYLTGAEHITSWLTVGDDMDAIAVALRVNVNGAGVAETVVVDYAINLSASWTTLGTISSDGVTVYLFPDSTTPVGTVFRHIRFRLTGATGTTTKTPDVLYLLLETRQKKKPKWAHIVVLDITKDSPDGRSPRQQKTDLRTAEESLTLVEFICHDDSAAGALDRYFVDVNGVDGLEQTGNDFTGEVTLLLEEA